MKALSCIMLEEPLMALRISNGQPRVAGMDGHRGGLQHKIDK